jgi:xylulokinase
LVKWFRDTFAAGEKSDDVYDRLTAEMPAAPTSVLVLPHFDPPPWPHYISDTSGIIMGLKSETARGEILKAIMECTTLYFVDSIDALKEVGATTESFTASGGGAKSDAWLQIKADIFGVPFVRPRITEGSLLGAAMLAGIATGVFDDAGEAAEVFVQSDRVFEPDAARHALYREKHALYRQVFDTNRELLRQL